MAEGDDRSLPPSGAKKPSRPALPTSRLGWSALWLAVAASALWLLLPVLGVLVFGEQRSGGFMVAALLLAVVAAVFNLLVVSVWKQRSVINIVALVLTVPNAVIAVAEGVSMLSGLIF